MDTHRYEREQKSILLERLREVPERLVIVTGPRQTGKTTLVGQVLDQMEMERPSRFLATDDPSPQRDPDWVAHADHEAIRSGAADTEWLVHEWNVARKQARGSERGFVLAIDEVQKIENWSEAVKGLWDADRRKGLGLHVVLLGSAPLLMQQGMSESLMGRYEEVRLAHWSLAEMSAAFGFDLQQFVYFGGYPGAASRIGDQQRWRSYVLDALVEPSIEKDILALQRIDKPALLRQLLELGAELSGQIVSYNKMLGQLHDAGNTTTLARYLQLLSAIGLLTGLPRHSPGVISRKASWPKLNVLNSALMAATSGYTFEQAQADRTFWGRLVESAVGAHLHNTGRPGLSLRYWRGSNREVDFVLEMGRRVVAIEVKSGARRPSTSGLRQFREKFAPLDTLVVGADGIPLQEFLSIPASRWFEER